jgi:hypothetical protein
VALLSFSCLQLPLEQDICLRKNLSSSCYWWQDSQKSGDWKRKIRTFAQAREELCAMCTKQVLRWLENLSECRKQLFGSVGLGQKRLHSGSSGLNSLRIISKATRRDDFDVWR